MELNIKPKILNAKRKQKPKQKQKQTALILKVERNVILEF